MKSADLRDLSTEELDAKALDLSRQESRGEGKA